MKPYLTLLGLALLLAFGAGALVLAPANEPPERAVPREELDALVTRFARESAPAATLALGRMFATGDGDALLDPAGLLPRTAELPADELTVLNAAVAACSFPLPRPLADPALAKAATWHASECGRGPLDAAFFERPPYLHPGGGSYVRLAVDSGQPRFRDPGWLTAHVSYAHAGELAALAALAGGLTLDRPRAVVAALGSELAALHDREPVVLARDHVLLTHAPAGVVTDPDVYDAYPRAAWDRWIAATPFRLARHVAGSPALGRRGRLSWQLDLERLRARGRMTQILELSGIALLGTGVLALLVFRVGARVEEARRRRFMLQTLTHELRTPLTSMTLCLEPLRESFDALPAPAQTAFLRICDDLARLGRVVETSRGYLRDATSRRLLDLAPVRVDSVNAWVAELLERAAPGADPGAPAPAGAEPVPVFAPLAPDAVAQLDPHWAGVCVTNLLQNAMRHGTPPVRVTAGREQDALVLTVEDAGACAFEDLDAMATPFVRGPASQGSGLGLAIARSIAAEMGGSLEYRSRPTRFRLRLPGVLA